MGVLVGTAGYSYKDWKGTFYPSNAKSTEMLEEYARIFPVVELNSTYYSIPNPERMDSLAERTPPTFEFTVKANREMTHEIKGDKEVFLAFRRSIRPLVDRGKLGCVLAQFPWKFKNTPESLRYLEFVAEMLPGVDVAVEFRNESWERRETFEFLKDLGLGYCCVDEPSLSGLPSRRVEATSKVGYVRFHGRNSTTWWDSTRESWERYNYLYSESELREWVGKVKKLSEFTERTYLIFNNHYKGNAPRNARMFERMLKASLGDGLYVVEEVGGGTGTQDENLTLF
ncbi:MAG: DUF72 domain-containing protein [Actinomycetota bacterium]|nr:DUF72 domain-containing protein [Actinomycetota bacterium]